MLEFWTRKIATKSGEKPQKIIAVFLIMTAAPLLLITVLPELDSLLKKKAVLACEQALPLKGLVTSQEKKN